MITLPLSIPSSYLQPRVYADDDDLALSRRYLATRQILEEMTNAQYQSLQKKAKNLML